MCEIAFCINIQKKTINFFTLQLSFNDHFNKMLLKKFFFTINTNMNSFLWSLFVARYPSNAQLNKQFPSSVGEIIFAKIIFNSPCRLAGRLADSCPGLETRSDYRSPQRPYLRAGFLSGVLEVVLDPWPESKAQSHFYPFPLPLPPYPFQTRGRGKGKG